MRIAQIAPLIESVPPVFYGGTERVVSYLTEALVGRGHEVTLFASGDSRSSAELLACAPRALRLDKNVRDSLPHHLLMLEEVRRRADSFDILHFHIDYLHFPLFRELAAKTVTTQHGRLDLPDIRPIFTAFAGMPEVSISLDQRRPLPFLNWVGNVPHGLPAELYRFPAAANGGYLAFLGRLCPEKRPDRAIAIARAAGMPLLIAAKVDRADEAYFEARIRPLLNHPGISYIGEIAESEKSAFLGGAAALLFPIDWPEPFGLVMIEAMACGTPVVAWRCGSVPEVVEDGVTGFVVESVPEAVHAVDRVKTLDRARIRRRFEERFSVERMVTDYLAIYETLIAGASRPAAGRGRAA